jgi:hypothetical protein
MRFNGKTASVGSSAAARISVLVVAIFAFTFFVYAPVTPQQEAYASGYEQWEDCDWDGYDDHTGVEVPWPGFDGTKGDTPSGPSPDSQTGKKLKEEEAQKKAEEEKKKAEEEKKKAEEAQKKAEEEQKKAAEQDSVADSGSGSSSGDSSSSPSEETPEQTTEKKKSSAKTETKTSDTKTSKTEASETKKDDADQEKTAEETTEVPDEEATDDATPTDSSVAPATPAAAPLVETPDKPEAAAVASQGGSIAVKGPEGSDGESVKAGETVTIEGTGFYGDVADLRVEIHSTPQVLGNVSSDADGTFLLTVALPKDFEPGAHEIVVLYDDLEIAKQAIEVSPAAGSANAADTNKTGVIILIALAALAVVAIVVAKARGKKKATLSTGATETAPVGK